MCSRNEIRLGIASVNKTVEALVEMLIKQSCSYQLSRWPNPSHQLKHGLSHQHSNEIIYDRRLHSKPSTYNTAFTFPTRWEGAGGRRGFMMRKRGNPKGQMEWGVEGEVWEGIYSVFMDACCENTEKGRTATEEKGRTGKQMIFGVKTCNRWFVFWGHVAPVDRPHPAVVCPPRLTPLSWPTPRTSPLTGVGERCLAGLAKVRHLDQGHSLPPTPLEPSGIIFLPTGFPVW